jgi:hydroxyethylthiazole kinase-like uncharacterized protein yjeF
VRYAYAVEEVRAAEHAALTRTGEPALPTGQLMQRAATALATVAARFLADRGGVYGARVVVLAGSGDNGGDALYAAAALARRGARVDVLATGRLHEGGWAALRSAGGRSFTPGEGESAGDRLLFESSDLVLDGLVGIGGRGALREPAARLARLAAVAADRTIAVDVPSGVDATTGNVAGEAVQAAVTVTFGLLKPGLLVQPGASRAGDVQLIDIGLPRPAAAIELLEDADVAERLPRPGTTDSKYSRGVLGVTAGSDVYTGAAVLVVAGAVHASAGMVRFVSVVHPAEQVRAAHPEAVVTTIAPGDAEGLLAAGRVQAWVAGPGMGTGRDSAAILRAVLGTDVPVLVDADGLTLLAEHDDLRRDLRGRRAPTLLTPHAGEFTRLTGQDQDEVARDRLSAVRAAARDLGATVLLKGANTVVCSPAGMVRINPTGTSWLATAGSGDVLSGICGSLLAGGLDALDAGSVGAYLHGVAAELTPPPFAAPELAREVPAAVRRILDAGTGDTAGRSW